jgi:hypothetical protein
MSPDIEWRVGEDGEQETIAKVASNVRRSRRSLWVVIGVIGLGAALGLLYRSIPDPPAKSIDPAPVTVVTQSTQPPRPTTESLASAIERDAFRLAMSAGEANHMVTFDPALGRMPQAYADWYAALQNAHGRWGPEAPQPLITVHETGTLSSGMVWAKVGQFRRNDFFRHTRFYLLQSNRWEWTLPDFSFWSGAVAEVSTGDAGTIGPATIVHPIEDAPVVGAVFDRFTRAYQNLCESLKCPAPNDGAGLWTPGLTLFITIQPLLTMPDVQVTGSRLNIALPSPRVVGYYEDANTPGDPFVAMAYATLIDPIVQLASGNYARWENKHGGELFLPAIAIWKRAQVRSILQPSDLFFPPTFPPPPLARLGRGQASSLREEYAAVLRSEALLPLDSLWDWPTEGRGFGLLQHIAVNEAEAVVAFIIEQYGEDGLVDFLNALGPAQSLEEAIEAALPVSFEEFNRQWKRWIAGE